jgi:XTP/dITP diphosphohydrolase
LQVVLASGNSDKCKEIQDFLVNASIKVVLQKDLNVNSIPETGLSFVENALIKARHACLATGLPSIADDSGLEVPALNGAPGIYSARYAGIDNNFQSNIDKLLLDLKKINAHQAKARFVCALVFMRSFLDATPEIFVGTWDGEITNEKRGKNGFGYDPVFYIPHLKATAAELSVQTKQKISHRANAMHGLINFLTTNF